MAHSVTRLTWSLAGDVALFGGSAGFAAFTAAASTLTPHRFWGQVAVIGYSAAALIALWQLTAAVGFGPRPWVTRATGLGARAAVTGAAWLATAILPLVLGAWQRAAGRTDRAQEEVLVVEHAGHRLVETGTPYLTRADIAAMPAAEQLLGYTPYQPGMAIFGVPRAIAGQVWWTDARVWFALATLVALLVAAGLLLAAAGQSGAPAPEVPAHLLRAVQAATVLPLSALTLATGGDDLPVLALCLLALALAATDRFGWAGLAMGLAGGMKLFALPLAVVLLALAATRGGAPARRYAAGAVGLSLLALLPAVVVSASAVAENVLRFPLGRGLVTSPAQSPLPGYLIANGLPHGRIVALALLGLVALVLAGWLIRRPPGTAAAAAVFCAIGFTAGIALLPATRFGYLLYPVAIAVLAMPLASIARRSPCPRTGKGAAALPR